MTDSRFLRYLFAIWILILVVQLASFIHQVTVPRRGKPATEMKVPSLQELQETPVESPNAAPARCFTDLTCNRGDHD